MTSMTFKALFKTHYQCETSFQSRPSGLLREVRECFTRALPALTLVWMLSPIVFSASIDSLRYRPGLRNSSNNQRLSARQLQLVLESLRHKSGFLEMRFDESSFLTLGDRTRIAGGSMTVRELLIATVEGGKVFELENHDRSPYVAFARLGEGSIHVRSLTNAEIEVRPVQIDFLDFEQLWGSREALAAFDLGFAVLHELAHGVLNLQDAVGDTTQLGGCDEHINRIRRELGLAERQHYKPHLQITRMPRIHKNTIQAELLFVRMIDGPVRGKAKRFYLRWDAEKVSVIKFEPPRRDGQTRVFLQQ